MTALPIDPFLPEIVAKVREARSLVLVAPPGAGKTTRVPTALLRAGLLAGDYPRLLMLQPRRVAARTVAARIADENGWTLGEQVGYQVRFERVLRPNTPLRVITEGILTRQLLADPFLTGVGAVLLDEFHERSLHSDLAVALLREVQQTVRPDLLLIIMSATLEAEPAAAFLGGCPIVRATGRTYPVEIRYELPSTNLGLGEQIAAAVQQQVAAPAEQTGDVLAFLPGAEEIRRAERLLQNTAERENLRVLPLYGSLPAEQQNLALRPAAQRKVILATNIAETSLTIDGVRTVIDTGFARVASYDAERGLDRLDLQRISKASATQRAGRAGRTAPGTCVRLWSEKQQHALADFDLPEIRRVDLAATVLTLHAWGKPDVRGFGWYERPSDAALLAAESLLAMLGALEGTPARLTKLGQQLVDFPTHPRVARLLLAAADAGLAREGAALAALISEKDIVPFQPGRREPNLLADSDLLHRLSLLGEAERQRFAPSLFDRGIDPAAARTTARVRDDLLRLLDRRPAGSPAPPDALIRLPLHAYPDRVCKRRATDPAAGAMVGGGGVRLAPESAVRHGELFLAVDLRHDARSASREALVRVASTVHVQWLAELFPQSIRHEESLEFDPQRQRVVGVRRRWYLDLLLEEESHGAVNPAQAGKVLAAALRQRAAELFTTVPAAAELLARVALLRKFAPEHPWPHFDLTELLAEACHGKRSTEELRGSALVEALLSQLAYPLDRLLDQLAPTTYTVPTGNRIALQYSPDAEAPVLAVRLQELFGLPATPRVAAGRVPVKLHLLGPNYRPVQITGDLAHFWATTYFQVRKDLRARYPKHAWPDNPLTAPPQAKGRSTAPKPH